MGVTAPEKPAHQWNIVEEDGDGENLTVHWECNCGATETQTLTHPAEAHAADEKLAGA